MKNTLTPGGRVAMFRAPASLYVFLFLRRRTIWKVHFEFQVQTLPNTQSENDIDLITTSREAFSSSKVTVNIN